MGAGLPSSFPIPRSTSYISVAVDAYDCQTARLFLHSFFILVSLLDKWCQKTSEHPYCIYSPSHVLRISSEDRILRLGMLASLCLSPFRKLHVWIFLLPLPLVFSPSFSFSILLRKLEVLPSLALRASLPFLCSVFWGYWEGRKREPENNTSKFWAPSPPLQRIWEPRKTAVLSLWRFVFHLIRLRSVRVSKRCLRSKTKVKLCFYVSFIFFLEDLFSFILWSTNSAVNCKRLDLVVQCARLYRIRQGMVRVFLVTFYLHKFITSAFCARLEQWGLTASTAFSLVAEQPTPSVSFSYFPAYNFRWKASSWKAVWPLLVVFSLLEFSPKYLSTLVLFSYGKAKLIPYSMWYHFSAWK